MFATAVPLLGVSSAATPAFLGGQATNVFFETPSWPSGTFSINLEYNHSTSAGTSLVVAPNVMMVDADANYFIRGSSLFASSTAVAVGTAAVSINVVYSASLINVVPVGSRASAANSAWVQPGDRIDIYKSFGSNGNTTAGVSYPATGSNQSTVETGADITVQACRHRTGSTSYALDFNAAIRSTGFHAHITGKSYSGPAASPGVITVTAGEVLPYNDGDSVILTYAGGSLTGVTSPATVFLGNITRTPDGPNTFQVYTASAAAAIAGAGGVAITGASFSVSSIVPVTSGTAIFGQHLSTGVVSTAALDLAIRYSDGTIKKLAVDGLTLQVQGRSSVDNSVLWTGTLTSAINLSYTANNKAGLIASMFDPARFTQVSKLWAKYNTRPLPGATTTLASQKISIDRDNNAGGEPYRCISIINTGSVAYQVALTINPIS